MKSVSSKILALLAILPAPLAAAPALTVYNDDLGVVRETLRLDLDEGLNPVEFSEITARLEPGSVVLHDLAGTRTLRILEQSYRADPLDQNRLLARFEGETIGFEIRERDRTRTVDGRIVRAPHPGAGQPIVEIDGRLRFGLPGTPLFPDLGDDSILKPTLTWLLATDSAGESEAEISYLTGGLSWEAAYNLVAPPEGDTVDLVGWVTLDNRSGRTFHEAVVKLMAGDVHRVRRDDARARPEFAARALMLAEDAEPGVTQRAFDEYHLYDLRRPITLRDRETKQVEFVRAEGVEAGRLYIYDGAAVDWNQFRHWNQAQLRTHDPLGTESQSKVWVMREFENSVENALGIPLPRGITRFYLEDEDGRLEFTGENTIDHTPRNETVRIYTGNAFDLVGERTRTDFSVDTSRRWARESFEINLRNRKEEESVTIRVREHLYRWRNWEIETASHEFEQKDSRRIEFPVEVGPDGEATVSYTVFYTW